VRGDRAPWRLDVDWQACDARGLCAELLPESVVLDEWGYPVVTGEVPRRVTGAAQEAVRSCPTRALRLHTPPSRPS
jgi:ferredoxin